MFASQFGTGSSSSSNMQLITANGAKSVWGISANALGIDFFGLSDTNATRPSINLKSTIVIKSGSGTKQDPFIVGLPS